VDSITLPAERPHIISIIRWMNQNASSGRRFDVGPVWGAWLLVTFVQLKYNRLT